MGSRTLKVSFATATVITSVLASLVIQRQALIKFRENDRVLRQQDDQLATLAAENQRLSDLVNKADSPPATNASAELVRLRNEAQALRSQIDELGKRQAEPHRPQARRTASMQDSPTKRIGGVSVMSDSESEEYNDQLHKLASVSKENPRMGDAYNLKYGVWKYALAHEGEFPSSLDQVAPYCYKGDLPLAGTYKGRDPMAGADEFELVYRGSRQELTNVPEEAVAMIREREAWPTPRGQWARIYVMATGHIIVVESDDNFQSWEAEHVLPPHAEQ